MISLTTNQIVSAIMALNEYVVVTQMTTPQYVKPEAIKKLVEDSVVVTKFLDENEAVMPRGQDAVDDAMATLAELHRELKERTA